jgi:hypothetical protein
MELSRFNCWENNEVMFFYGGSLIVSKPGEMTVAVLEF